MKIKCPNCNNKIKKKSIYCDKCGNKVDSYEIKKNSKRNRIISIWDLLGIALVLILLPISIYCLSSGISGLLNTNTKYTDNTKTSSKNNIINKILGEKTLTCSKTETDEDGYETIDDMVITYKNNKVTKVKETNTSKMDSSYIELTLSFGIVFAEAFNTIDGLNVEYSKISDDTLQFVMEVDYSKINADNIKEVLGDLYDDSQDTIYMANNLSLDKFKKDNLDGYTCN